LDRFGSLEGVRKASREELRDALGGVVGDRVFEELRVE
jgi:hypothetical protein